MEPKQKPEGLLPKEANAKARKPKTVRKGMPKGVPAVKAVEPNQPSAVNSESASSRSKEQTEIIPKERVQDEPIKETFTEKKKETEAPAVPIRRTIAEPKRPAIDARQEGITKVLHERKTELPVLPIEYEKQHISQGIVPKGTDSVSKSHEIPTPIQQSTRIVKHAAQELYAQTAEAQDSTANEYAEQKVEQYGQETANAVTQSAEQMQSRARNAAIRHFKEKQQEKIEAEAEQSQMTAEQDSEHAHTEAEEEQPQVTAEQGIEDYHTVVEDASADMNSPTVGEPAEMAMEADDSFPQFRETDVRQSGGDRLQDHTDPLQRQRQEQSQGEYNLHKEPVRQDNRTGSSISRTDGERNYVKGQEKAAYPQAEKADQVRLPEPDRSHAKMRYPTDRSQTVSPKQRLVQRTAKETHFSVKTAHHGVKESKQTVKTVQKTAQTTRQTAKAAQKAAQASAKAAKETSVKAAQATTKAGQALYKILAAVIKTIIEGVKKLVSVIAAGGWVSVVVIAVIAVIAIILVSAFGIFYSNDVSEGRPMTEAIEEINNEFVDSINARISRYKRRYQPDEVILVYEGDTDSGGTVMNWMDVLGVYAVGTTTDPNQPSDVLIVTSDKIEQLRTYFRQMNSVSYHPELETEQIPATDENGEPLLDEEGEPVMDTKKTLTITIRVSSMDYREAASKYSFDESQRNMLTELMKPEYYPLYAQLTGDVIGDGGEFGFGLDINPNLPPSELGYQIVQVAKRYIGRSYASMDCSKFARTAYADVGLTSMNGLSSVRMAEKCQEMGCLFTDPSQLQAGDLIFFARFDPSRGKDYCGDINRCGTGKCRRWLHIHHVAIYINDEYLIDSVGGDNSVQIRRLYGQDTPRWKWVCFGRPTT